MPSIIKECPTCKQPFKSFLSANRKYCSRKCTPRLGKPSKVGKINRVCEQCRADFSVYPSQIKKGGGKFCSLSCGTTYRNKTNNPSKRPEVREKISKNHADVSGKNNPMYGVRPKTYKNGYTNSGKNYYRFIAFNSFPSICNRCGLEAPEKQLEIHHKDRNRKNNELINLEVLCAKCHKEEHKGEFAREKDKKTGRFLKKPKRSDAL